MDELKVKHPGTGGLYQQFHHLLNRGFLFAESHLNRLIDERFNPFYHLGSLIFFNLLVLSVTGTYMFIYYSPSVETVYESVQYVNDEAFLGGLTRSIHQYSSDLMMVLIVLHMIRVFAQDKYRKYRWLAWTSGVVMLFLTLIEGVTGHIMIWNSRAQLIVDYTARLLASLKVFGEDLPRAFTAEALLSTWIMWILLAIHLLIPITFIFLIYIHLSRISRSRILPPKVLKWGMLTMIVIFSILFPVKIYEKADLMTLPVIHELDWFYLFLVPLINKLDPYLILGGTLLVFAVLMGVPWYRGRLVVDLAQRDLEICTGCAACAKDCPYEAIYMRKRTDGKKFRMESAVLDSRCAGCGICVGSCSFGGMDLKEMSAENIEDQIAELLHSGSFSRENTYIGIFCRNSIEAGDILDSEERRLVSEPRMRVLRVPCAGMTGPELIQKCLDRGVRGVIIAACRQNDCYYREGNLWLHQRLIGRRVPKLRLKDEQRPVFMLTFNRKESGEFVKTVSSQLDSWESKSPAPNRRGVWQPLKSGSRSLSALAVAAVSSLFLFGFAWGALDPFGNYEQEPRALIRINFFHLSDMVSCDLGNLANAVEKVRSRIDHVTRKDNIPKEGQNQRISSTLVSSMLCPRERETVRIKLEVNGQLFPEKTFEPIGIKNDGLTYVSHEVEVPPGEHLVRLNMLDSSSPKRASGISYSTRRKLNENQILYIDFDEKAGEFFIRE